MKIIKTVIKIIINIMLLKKKNEVNINTELNYTLDKDENIEYDKNEINKEETNDKICPNILENSVKKDEVNKFNDDNRPIHLITTPFNLTEDKRLINPMKTSSKQN